MFADVVGTCFAGFLRASVDSFAVTAILSMLPGMALYKGLWALEESLNAALPFLVTAASTAFVLAACLTFGEDAAGQVVQRVVHAKDYFMPVFEKPFSNRRE